MRTLTALRSRIVGMTQLAILARRAPDQHDRRLLLLLLSSLLQPAQVLARDKEGRREVRADRRLPLRKRHLRNRHLARLVVRVVDHHDLYGPKPALRVRGGGEEALRVVFAGQVRLQRAQTRRAVLSEQRLEWRGLGVVVRSHARADLCVSGASAVSDGRQGRYRDVADTWWPCETGPAWDWRY